MASGRANARNRGKVWERDVASRLGTKRTGPTGMDDADVIHEVLGVECKAYARITLLAADWQQAVDNAKGRIPVLAVKPKGNTAGAVAVITYDYWCSLSVATPVVYWREYKRIAFRVADWKTARDMEAHLGIAVKGKATLIVMPFDDFVTM